MRSIKSICWQTFAIKVRFHSCKASKGFISSAPASAVEPFMLSSHFSADSRSGEIRLIFRRALRSVVTAFLFINDGMLTLTRRAGVVPAEKNGDDLNKVLI